MDNQMFTIRGFPFSENFPLLHSFFFTPSNLCITLNESKEVNEILDVFPEIELHGQITDKYGIPAKGIMIEMWHHSNSALLRMEFGASCAPFDPDGQDWKMDITNENGEYSFKTPKLQTPNGQEATAINFKVTDENGHITLAKLYPISEFESCADPYFNSLKIEERYQCMGRMSDEGIEFDIQL